MRGRVVAGAYLAWVPTFWQIIFHINQIKGNSNSLSQIIIEIQLHKRHSVESQVESRAAWAVLKNKVKFYYCSWGTQSRGQDGHIHSTRHNTHVTWDLGRVLWQHRKGATHSTKMPGEDLKRRWNLILGFPGGSVIRSPPANAGDSGLIPGLGRHHILWSNQAHRPQVLTSALEPVLCNNRSHRNEEPRHHTQSSPCLLQLAKSSHSNEDPARPAKNK